MKKFKDIHVGEPCYLVGTGPSLNKVDISKLNKKITIGCNRTFLKPELKIKYYAVESERTVTQHVGDIKEIKCDTKFIPIRYRNYQLGDNVQLVNFVYNYANFPLFSFDCDKIIYWGCNVLYMMLQISVYMGCNPVYLVGIDWFENFGDIQKHFHEENVITNYDPPRIPVQNRAMNYAANVLKDKGVAVFNTNKDSKLKAFPYKYEGSIYST